MGAMTDSYDAIFQTSQHALFATTGVERKAPVLDKLHDHSYHVFVRQESEQLAGEATVPDSVISRCQFAFYFFLLQNSPKCFGSAKLFDPQLISHTEIHSAQQGAVDR